MESPTPFLHRYYTLTNLSIEMSFAGISPTRESRIIGAYNYIKPYKNLPFMFLP